MSTITIPSFTLPHYQLPGTVAFLRIWFDQDFVTAEGLAIMGGPIRTGKFYLDIECTVSSETITVPEFELPTTNDSSVRNARAAGLIFSSANVFVDFLFANWIIPSGLAPSATFAALNAYNAAITRPPDPTYPTTDQIVAIMQGVLDAFGLGNLTENTVPRATSEDTLEDGLAVDNGVDFSVQTTGICQFGDFGGEQNGSFLSVNDALTELGGRTNIFAGGADTVEYAGVSADCSLGSGEISVQSTGITHLYGSNQVTKLGDGKDEQQGTKVIINDPTRMVVQTVANLTPNDPSINTEQACFYLDEDNDKLMVRVRYSDGTYKSGEVALT